MFRHGQSFGILMIVRLDSIFYRSSGRASRRLRGLPDVVTAGTWPYRRRSCSSGLTLVEVLVSLLILGIALAGFLPAAWNAIRAVSLQRERILARELAFELYEEIKSLPREPSSVAAAPATLNPLISADLPRAEFESVLHYDGLLESPPRDPLGAPIPGAEAFSRSVRLWFVDPLAPECEVSASSSDLVAIEVEVGKDGVPMESLRFLRALR